MTVDTSWHEPALALRAEGLDAAEVGERVGKHPATVRKLFARNNFAPRGVDEPEVPFQPTSTEVHSSNGNGNGHVDHETAERLRAAAGFDVVGAGYEPDTDPIPGQTTIDGGEVGYDKSAFEAEAGEAVGPMPPREMDAGEPVAETRLQGTRQLAIDFGPEADIPTGGTLVVKSEKLASGHFGLGDVITGTFTARITDAGGKERFDKDAEEFRAKPTAYVATITDLTVD